MTRLGFAGVAFALAGMVAMASGEEKGLMVEYSLKPVQVLVAGELNALEPFTPRLHAGGGDHTERHTPMLASTLPWGENQGLFIEVPEYSWAHVEGDPSNNSPFFYGRKIGTGKLGVVRFPSKEEPQWKQVDGALHLDNPLEGGYVQRFRVIPRDRMLEIRFGVTNNSDKPLENLRCQLCARFFAAEGFRSRWPTTAKMLADGEVISWDGAGQDLSWIEPHFNKDTGRFNQSCFFQAPVKGHKPDKIHERPDTMWLNRPVDVPAIAKQHTTEQDRYIVAYSPFCPRLFYNVNTPCEHADPEMPKVAPGETRWTVSYFIYFEGDIARLFEGLRELHRDVARQEGVLEK